MTFGPSSPAHQTPVDDSSLEEFLTSTSQLPAEEWQKRIAILKTLVHSIPDYSTTPSSSSSSSSTNGHRIAPWYRSSKHVRRLFPSLRNYILDARSALVKEATELIGTLLMVKLQHHPNADQKDATDAPQSNEDKRPPPPFVGRLLFKDLLPALLQLSSQTVKVIRSYGSSLLLDVLPHCRVPSSLVMLCERIKSDKNRCVKEDCARYLRCVLETWPCDEALMACSSPYQPVDERDNVDKDNNSTILIPTQRFRKDECLTIETVKQIGWELGRSLSDPAQPVRNESKKGFQVLFRRFRPIWNEVMKINSGVIRDVRLRRKLLEAAARSDGRDVEDLASLDDGSIGGMSYGSMRSGISQLTFRSYASRGGVRPNTVPNTIDTPKTRSKVLQTSREAISDYSPNTYVTTSGQVFSTPSPRRQYRPPSYSSGKKDLSVASTQQPFASLLKTPLKSERSPIYPLTPLGLSSKSQKVSTNVLRKRLSRRISGVQAMTGDGELYSEIRTETAEQYPRQLSSINETEDNKCGNQLNNPSVGHIPTTQFSEITTVALEVIEAHLSHLQELEAAMSKEKELLADLEKISGVALANNDRTSPHVTTCLASLTEEEVCDYFESLHVCVDKQLISSEKFLMEMEKISRGGDNEREVGDDFEERIRSGDEAQSPDLFL
ncbi:hypothetical protein HJC23_003123 [Cyclotella cryptica]|uniref:CLASP N-terminal domain-containing protein n=1 Tax=Cyclotella cryptica TaxID=29204 RepID=A0ABD3P4I4_9STRA|eukprot:CCRYP_017511-RA/>CCRYP_017511-RA protein AED:0.00 eAED:0.00 QI:253/-1/1/1/-1/1/1/213/664